MPIEAMSDGLQHIVGTVHEAASTVSGDLPGAEQVVASDLADSSSNAVSQVDGKTESLAKAKMLQVAHRRHKYVLRIVRFMLRNSLLNKLKIMVPGFLFSLVVPKPILQALRPAFALFGAHLSMEASKDAIKLIKKRRQSRAVNTKSMTIDPERVLEEKVPNRMSIRQVIEKARETDKVTTREITAAVLGSIDTLPVAEQIPIMAIYVAGMTGGVYGATTALVKMEDWGQRMQAWQPHHPLKKLFAKTTIPVRIGVQLQKATPRVFRVIPWTGAAAKFVTSGRVISHSVPLLEKAIEQGSKFVAEAPLVGGETLGFFNNVALWGVTGFAVGLGIQAGQRFLYRPALTRLKNSPMAAQWKKAAAETLVMTVLSQKLHPDHKTRESKRANSHIMGYPLDVYGYS